MSIDNDLPFNKLSAKTADCEACAHVEDQKLIHNKNSKNKDFSLYNLRNHTDIIVNLS